MKLQMKFEKIISFVVLISSSICFIFALGITTDIYNLMFLKDFGVDGYELYFNIQPFNRRLVVLSILMIVLAVTLFITRVHDRRKYYISNYINILLLFIINVVISIWAITKLNFYKQYFLENTDFEGWKFVTTIISNVKYAESTFWLDISIITYYISIVSSILLVGNLIWKIVIIRYENNLLSGKIKVEVPL